MLSDHSETLLQTFKGVINSLNKLCLHIHDELPKDGMWVANGEGSFEANRDKLIYALKQLSLVPGLSSRETYSCPGAVAANQHTLALATLVNTAKDSFKAAVQACKKENGALAIEFVHNLLARSGYYAINLRQVYRHLQMVEYHPSRIAWTKAKGGSHVVISREEAESLLKKAGSGEHIQIQLSKLSLLSPSQKLVIHWPSKPYWIVNITSTEDKRSLLMDIRTSLPIFYLNDNNLEHPTICFSNSISKEIRKTRNDKKIEDEPFLPSIHAYRYKAS